MTTTPNTNPRPSGVAERNDIAGLLNALHILGCYAGWGSQK